MGKNIYIFKANKTVNKVILLIKPWGVGVAHNMEICVTDTNKKIYGYPSIKDNFSRATDLKTTSVLIEILIPMKYSIHLV